MARRLPATSNECTSKSEWRQKWHTMEHERQLKRMGLLKVSLAIIAPVLVATFFCSPQQLVSVPASTFPVAPCEAGVSFEEATRMAEGVTFFAAKHSLVYRLFAGLRVPPVAEPVKEVDSSPPMSNQEPSQTPDSVEGDEGGEGSLSSELWMSAKKRTLEVRETVQDFAAPRWKWLKAASWEGAVSSAQKLGMDKVVKSAWHEVEVGAKGVWHKMEMDKRSQYVAQNAHAMAETISSKAGVWATQAKVVTHDRLADAKVYASEYSARLSRAAELVYRGEESGRASRTKNSQDGGFGSKDCTSNEAGLVWQLVKAASSPQLSVVRSTLRGLIAVAHVYALALALGGLFISLYSKTLLELLVPRGQVHAARAKLQGHFGSWMYSGSYWIFALTLIQDFSIVQGSSWLSLLWTVMYVIGFIAIAFHHVYLDARIAELLAGKLSIVQKVDDLLQNAKSSEAPPPPALATNSSSATASLVLDPAAPASSGEAQESSEWELLSDDGQSIAEEGQAVIYAAKGGNPPTARVGDMNGRERLDAGLDALRAELSVIDGSLEEHTWVSEVILHGGVAFIALHIWNLVTHFL